MPTIECKARYSLCCLLNCKYTIIFRDTESFLKLLSFFLIQNILSSPSLLQLLDLPFYLLQPHSLRHAPLHLLLYLILKNLIQRSAEGTPAMLLALLRMTEQQGADA